MEDGGGSAAGRWWCAAGASKVKVVSCCDGDGDGERRRGDHQIARCGCQVQDSHRRAGLEEGGNLKPANQGSQTGAQQWVVSGERSSGGLCVCSIPGRQAGRARHRPGRFHRLYSSHSVNQTITVRSRLLQSHHGTALLHTLPSTFIHHPKHRNKVPHHLYSSPVGGCETSQEQRPDRGWCRVDVSGRWRRERSGRLPCEWPEIPNRRYVPDPGYS